jgi:hypothetical protein
LGSIGPIYGSIDGLWPKDLDQGRNFFYAGTEPDGRGLKSNFLCISYENKILLVFKKDNESDVGPEGERVTKDSPLTYTLSSIFTL